VSREELAESVLTIRRDAGLQTRYAVRIGIVSDYMKSKFGKAYGVRRTNETRAKYSDITAV
jgi:hypothetical protein